MAGLPWFELDTDYHDSPKVEALKSRLRNPEADAFPSRIYAYCYRHAVDRFDAEVASHTLESAAKWRGRRGFLFDALFAVGVLEREGGKVVVHGVGERLAPHLSKRAGDAERQQRRRDRAAESVRRHGPVTRDVTGESRSNRNRNKNKDTEQQPAGGLPTRDELRFGQYPLAASLRQRLAEEWPGLGWTKRPDSDNAAVERCGLDACASACLVHGRASKIVPETLGFFSGLLADLRPRPVAVEPPPPKLDLSWIDALPEAEQREVVAEWGRRRADVEGFFAKERQPMALASAAEALRVERTGGANA